MSTGEEEIKTLRKDADMAFVIIPEASEAWVGWEIAALDIYSHTRSYRGQY